MRAFCSCLSSTPFTMCAFCSSCLSATHCTMCAFFLRNSGLQKQHLALRRSAVCTGSKVHQNIQMSNREVGDRGPRRRFIFLSVSHNALFLSLVAKYLIERDLSFFLHFFLSMLKSVFGRENESAMLTRNKTCGKKSDIRQVRGARSTSTFIQDNDCTAR